MLEEGTPTCHNEAATCSRRGSNLGPTYLPTARLPPATNNNIMARLRVLRRRLATLEAHLRMLRMRQRHLRTLEVTCKFSQLNAMVGDWIEERIRFRCTAALRASKQIRFIVRAWRQQVNQLECAMRRVAFRRRALEEAHEGYVEALKHLRQCFGFNPPSAALPLLDV